MYKGKDLLFMEKTLFNPINKQHEDYGKYLFEQYKMFVELADRVSQRRANANNFYITANAALLTIASWFKDDFGNYMYLISAVGITISLFWFFTINSYKQLNSGKFKVIHKIEEQLPLALFEYEWELLGKGEMKKIYFPLSHIERVIPLIFIVLYIALSVFICFSL